MFKRRDVYRYRAVCKTCSVYILIARVQVRIKPRYRGGGRKGDGLRCERGAGGGELGDNKEV